MLLDTHYEARRAEEIFHAKLKPWQRIMLSAVEVLKQRGWHQGWYVHPAGDRVCTAGALFVVVTGIDEPSMLQVFFRPWILRRIGRVMKHYTGMRIPDWNDHHKRTKTDVIHTLQLVALG